MPYKKHFGDGYYSGLNFLTFDLSNYEKDVVVTLVDAKTRLNVRCQFIRWR